MAIYQLQNGKVDLIKPSGFSLEKDLQRIIESNLQTIFNCKFVATEFSTGSLHAGRIDTLALSEDKNPVIIEYKKVASSELINQSLYYLHWMRDHKGDFQVAVNKVFGTPIEVDWSEIRVICIAPEYKKYDLHAVQVMGANIELWQYKLYENGILNLDEVYRKTEGLSVSEDNSTEKDPVMVAAGKKAALTKKTATYSLEDHRRKISGELLEVFNEVRLYIMNLGSSIEETPKLLYVSYKTSQNFVCIEVQKSKLYLYLKINANDVKPLPRQCRDVKNIGHFGTGDFEITLRTMQDFQETKELINLSLKNVGG